MTCRQILGSLHTTRVGVERKNILSLSKSLMGRKRDDDEDTVLTVDLSLDPLPTEAKFSNKSAPSKHTGAAVNMEWTPAQNRQLENARQVALRNRRERLQAKLAARLTELNSQLGVSGPQMEKIAHAMMKHEENLRTRMNSHLTEISNQIHELKVSLQGGGTARSEVSVASSRRS